VLAWWPHQGQRRPLLVEGLLVQEFDGAEGNRDRTTGRFLFVGEVEKVSPQFFVADLVWRLAIVLGQLTNGGHVGFLSSLGQAAQLHVLDHALSEERHALPPVAS
jgi:hypothetical protein